MTAPRQNAVYGSRLAEFFGAGALAVLAIAISPLALPLLTGRPELSFRASLLSVTFGIFLLLLAAGLVTRGRARQIAFHLIAWSLPLVALAGIELLAGALRLSDRVALFQDYSTIKRGNNWGPGALHLEPERDGFAVYRPWSGNGVTVNALGLRTSLPQPKRAGGWRVAVVGGSETFGFRLADDDTIPALLQAALRRAGHPEITVYNFGIEDATLAKQLALLRHFRDTYDLDQALFIMGGGDVYRQYFSLVGAPLEASGFGRRLATFELYKTVDRIRRTWFDPAPAVLAQLDARLAANTGTNQLTDGIKGADTYCQEARLRCDFVLQPLIQTRGSLVGSEPRLARTYNRLYPRLGVLAERMYREARALDLKGRVHDLTRIFDANAEQVFIDGGHNNEMGHQIFADALAPIVSRAAQAR